jgi:hypothetical protein
MFKYMLQPPYPHPFPQRPPHLEAAHGVLKAGHEVHVVVERLVAHVALHKHLTGGQAQNLVGLGGGRGRGGRVDGARRWVLGDR